jgi:hypothetical protein
MHPFVPVTSVLFLCVADAVMVFLRLSAGHSEVLPHIAPLYAIVLASLIFGGSVAFWLRRFGIRYPSWLAVFSLLLFAVLRMV